VRRFIIRAFVSEGDDGWLKECDAIEVDGKIYLVQQWVKTDSGEEPLIKIPLDSAYLQKTGETWVYQKPIMTRQS